MKIHEFERRHQRVVPFTVFAGRFVVFLLAALAMMALWIAAGTMLFHRTLQNATWVDAFHHASLLASGMGPVPELRQGSDTGKIVESLYSLVSGFVLLAAAGVVAAPIVHRVLHRFHVDERER
jgi:hypothetical protein